MSHLFIDVQDEHGKPLENATALSEAEALALMETAEITGTQLVPWGSNYTFAVALDAPDRPSMIAIYKPRAGEAPLWDFPDDTLYLRETAAYLLSRLLPWHLVPPTIVRDGPHGVGSLQQYIKPVPEEPAEQRRFWSAKTIEVERMVLFDFIANNADRKIGHCLRDSDGKVWGIDHGLTFNVEPKLRTVLWQFNGDAISAPLLEDLRFLHGQAEKIRQILAPFLMVSEIEALIRRVRMLAETGCYPSLDPRRNIPYGWW